MTKYQLWSRDEYGQGSILFTSEDIDEVIKHAKLKVSDINVNNSLTSDDRERNWEAYMVVVTSNNVKANNQNICIEKSKINYVYGGGDPRTKDIVYSFGPKGKEETVAIKDIPNVAIKIYLGDISTKRGIEVDWFAQDVRRTEITSLDHQDLLNKTYFFIKKVES